MNEKELQEIWEQIKLQQEITEYNNKDNKYQMNEYEKAKEGIKYEN